MRKQDVLQEILTNLRTAIPELHGVLIVAPDGLPMAQSISNGLDPNRLGAMAATALGLGKRINETLSSGEFSEISVAGSRGQMLVYGAGQKAVLAVMSPSGANVGLINFEARNAAEKIIEALQ